MDQNWRKGGNLFGQ